MPGGSPGFFEHAKLDVEDVVELQLTCGKGLKLCKVRITRWLSLGRACQIRAAVFTEAHIICVSIALLMRQKSNCLEAAIYSRRLEASTRTSDYGALCMSFRGYA